MKRKMSTKRLYFDILDKRRVDILPKLKFLRRLGFYLAGGTALALQIRHRTSIDFDFYTPKDFDPKALFKRFKIIFKRIVSIHMAEGTLIITINDIGMSFFRYEYPLLKPLVKTEHIDLLSLEDIAAMKMISIVQRGTRRDFIDIFYLLKKFSLDKLLKLTKKKYEVFNRYLGLRALIYFEDAEKDKSRKRLDTFEKIGWSRVKKAIIDAVDKYRKENLSKR